MDIFMPAQVHDLLGEGELNRPPTAMGYETRITEYPDYVRVHVVGKRSPGHSVANADRVGKMIVELCEEKGINNILLVLELTGRLGPLDSMGIVTHSQEYGFHHNFRLAFVDLNAESYRDSLFTETVAVNRSYSMKVFDNEQDAREWLLG